MAVELRCIESGHTEKRWTLEVGGQACVMRDAAGAVVATFPREDAARRFRTPSMTEGTRHFAIAFDEQTVRFDVDPGGLSQIEDFLHRTPSPPRVVAMPHTGVAAGGAGARRARAGSAGSGGGAVKTLKAIIGLLALLYGGAQVVQLAMLLGQNGPSSPYRAGAVAGSATGVFIGVMVCLLCFRSIVRQSKRRQAMAG